MANNILIDLTKKTLGFSSNDCCTPAQANGETANASAAACCGGSSTAAATAEDIRSTVREHYAEHARTASACCPSPNTALYDPTLTAKLPSDITNFTLGCGDPITLASLKEGETVLDLGSGGGLDCFLAAQRVGASGKVIGVDMTPEMLAKARANAQKLNAANVEFREGYLEALPVADASVDVIISNCVINLSPDKAQVFREMYRVLKPGGRVAVSDIVTNGTLPKIVREDTHQWCECVAGAIDQTAYTQGLADAGFTNMRVQPKDATHSFLAGLPIGVAMSATITAKKI